MSFRKGLANVLRAVAKELDPSGQGEKILVRPDGAIRMAPAGSTLGPGYTFEDLNGQVKKFFAR